MGTSNSPPSPPSVGGKLPSSSLTGGIIPNSSTTLNDYHRMRGGEAQTQLGEAARNHHHRRRRVGSEDDDGSLGSTTASGGGGGGAGGYGHHHSKPLTVLLPAALSTAAMALGTSSTASMERATGGRARTSTGFSSSTTSAVQSSSLGRFASSAGGGGSVLGSAAASASSSSSAGGHHHASTTGLVRRQYSRGPTRHPSGAMGEELTSTATGPQKEAEALGVVLAFDTLCQVSQVLALKHQIHTVRQQRQQQNTPVPSPPPSPAAATTTTTTQATTSPATSHQSQHADGVAPTQSSVGAGTGGGGSTFLKTIARAKKNLAAASKTSSNTAGQENLTAPSSSASSSYLPSPVPKKKPASATTTSHHWSPRKWKRTTQVDEVYNYRLSLLSLNGDDKASPTARNRSGSSSGKDAPPSVRGLVNHGQTCYLNCILQALTSCKDVTNFLECIVFVMILRHEAEAGEAEDEDDEDDMDADEERYSYGGFLSGATGRGKKRGTAMGKGKKETLQLSDVLLDTVLSLGATSSSSSKGEGGAPGRGRGSTPLDPKQILALIGKESKQFQSATPRSSEQQDAEELLQSLLGIVVKEAERCQLLQIRPGCRYYPAIGTMAAENGGGDASSRDQKRQKITAHGTSVVDIFLPPASTYDAGHAGEGDAADGGLLGEDFAAEQEDPMALFVSNVYSSSWGDSVIDPDDDCDDETWVDEEGESSCGASSLGSLSLSALRKELEREEERQKKQRRSRKKKCPEEGRDSEAEGKERGEEAVGVTIVEASSKEDGASCLVPSEDTTSLSVASPQGDSSDFPSSLEGDLGMTSAAAAAAMKYRDHSYDDEEKKMDGSIASGESRGIRGNDGIPEYPDGLRNGWHGVQGDWGRTDDGVMPMSVDTTASGTVNHDGETPASQRVSSENSENVNMTPSLSYGDTMNGVEVVGEVRHSDGEVIGQLEKTTPTQSPGGTESHAPPRPMTPSQAQAHAAAAAMAAAKMEMATSSQLMRMLTSLTTTSPTPLTGWLGSCLQCCSCHHVRPINNAPFVDIPIVPTSVTNYLSRAGLMGNYGKVSPAGAACPSAYLPGCTLAECLTNFTCVERVTEVDCTNCTIREKIETLEDEMELLRGAIDSMDRKKIDALELRRELEAFESRQDALRTMDPDDIPVASSSVDNSDDAYASSSGDVDTDHMLTPKRTDAFKCLLLTRLPPVLCLHVQRRYYDMMKDRMCKAMQHVSFPEILDVSSFCAYSGTRMSSGSSDGGKTEGHSSASSAGEEGSCWAGHGRGASGTTDMPGARQPAEEKPNSRSAGIYYKLMSVVEHKGNAHGGHYQTYRRIVAPGPHRGRWALVSDEHVYIVDWKDVRRCQAYMLFYEAM